MGVKIDQGSSLAEGRITHR